MTKLARVIFDRTIRQMKRILTLVPAFAFALMSALFLTSCSNTSQIIATGLEVEVTGITQTSDGSALISWEFKNTNVVTYLFSHISHQISINGTPLGVIEDKNALPLAPNSTTGRTSTLSSLNAAASGALADAVKAGSANYHIDTQITVLLYDDMKEKSALSGSGTVVVKAK